jgi:catechol 2,3-dioxygenase-like lactoylglutathione lyase family enzyme
MTTTMQTLALSTIGQIALVVHDVERATEFYRDKLGMRFLFAAGPHLAFFDCDGVRLMLTRPEQKEFDKPGSVIYFKVRDIKGAYDGFKERGVSFIDEPHLIAPLPDHDLWMTFFKDLDGNTLALMGEMPKGYQP